MRFIKIFIGHSFKTQKNLRVFELNNGNILITIINLKILKIYRTREFNGPFDY